MDGEEREKRLILINVCELNLTKLEKIVIIVASINDWYEIALCVSTSTQQQQQQQQQRTTYNRRKLRTSTNDD